MCSRVLASFFILFIITGSAGQAQISCTENEGCADGIFYDSGRGGSGQVFSGVVTVVQKFTPSSYPFDLSSACISFARSAADSELDFAVVLFDDDGSNGKPGTELGTLSAVASNVSFFSTTTFYSTPTAGVFPSIESGSFYLGARWDTSANPGFLIQGDSEVDRTVVMYNQDGGAWTRSMSGGAVLIRAGTTAHHGTVLRPDASQLDSNLRLWLRAEDLLDTLGDGDEVLLWPDASGEAHDASPTLSSIYKPVLLAAGMPRVNFPDSNLRLLRAPSVFGGALPTDLTVVAMYRAPVSDASVRPAGFGANADGSTADNFCLATDPSIRKDNGSITGYAVGHPGDYFLRAATMSSTSGEVADFFNGEPALLPVSEAFVVGTDSFYVGELKDSFNDSAVDMVEVAVYDRALSATEIQGLSDYVNAKYRSRCYFRFEEGAAADPISDPVVDSTVNPNNATAVMATSNAPTWSAEVPLADIPLTGAANTGSLDLERDDSQYLEIDFDLSLAAESSLTIEAWVRLETLSDDSDGLNLADRQYLVVKKATNATNAELNYAFLVQAGNLAAGAELGNGDDHSLALQLGNGSAVTTTVSSFGISDTQWHYVAAAFDTDAGVVSFVLDDAVELLGGLNVSPFVNTSSLFIGAHHNAGVVNSSFDGLIDELRISGGLLHYDQLLASLPVLFIDGFETGDVSSWSNAAP